MSEYIFHSNETDKLIIVELYGRFGCYKEALIQIAKLLPKIDPNNELDSYFFLNNSKLYCLRKIGLINEGLELSRSLEYFIELNKTEILKSYPNSYARYLRRKAELFIANDQAIEAIEYLKLSKKIGTQPDQSSKNNVSLGIIYGYQGLIDLSELFIDQAIDNLRENNKNNMDQLSRALISIIEMQVINGLPIERINNYLNLLRSMNVPDDSIVTLRYKYAQAIIFFQSPRLADKIEAQNLFKELKKAEKISKDLYFKVEAKYVETLLYEISIINDPAIITELNEIWQHLEETYCQDNYSIKIKNLFLKGQIAVLQLKFQDAQKYFTIAETEAIGIGLQLLARKISNSHDELLDTTERWEVFHENSSYVERAKLIKYEDLLVKRLREGKKMFKDPEKPAFLQIFDSHGISLFSKNFENSKKSKLNNTNQILSEQLLSGFLVALNKFGQKTVNAPINRFKHGEYTVLLKEMRIKNFKKLFLISYMYKGTSYFAQKKLDRFVKRLRKDKKNLIKKFLESSESSKSLNTEDMESINTLITKSFLDN